MGTVSYSVQMPLSKIEELFFSAAGNSTQLLINFRFADGRINLLLEPVGPIRGTWKGDAGYFRKRGYPHGGVSNPGGRRGSSCENAGQAGRVRMVSSKLLPELYRLLRRCRKP